MFRSCLCLWLPWLPGMLSMAPTVQTQGELQDYCQWEQMHARCADNEAIIFEEALYGRMAYGRCIKRNYGYVGCHGDVRLIADKQCSGRPECSISIPNELFDGTTDCPDDLKMYLSARYRCIRVVTPPVRKCSQSQTAVITEPEGYLSSYITNTTGCGSASAPWRVQLSPGQRVNISVIDFTALETNRSSTVDLYGSCRAVLAIIKDRQDLSKPIKVCGSRVRERHVMLSRSHEVEIRIMMVSSNFLVHFQAVGCPDLKHPGGWFRRDSQNPQRAEVGCERDGAKWTLTCEGHAWKGMHRNCSRSSSAMGNTQGPGAAPIQKSSAFLIVIGIAVVLGFGILAIGILVIKRQHGRNQQRQRGLSGQALPPYPLPPNVGKTTGPGDVKEQLPYPVGRETAYTVAPPLLGGDTSPYADENDYAYVEEYQSISPNTLASGSCPQHRDQTAPGGRELLYKSLEDSAYRPYTHQGGATDRVSPAKGQQLHPYHVLDRRDGGPDHSV